MCHPQAIVDCRLCRNIKCGCVFFWAGAVWFLHHAAWFFAHCIFLISTRVALLDLLRVIGTVRAVEGRRNCSWQTCKISSQLLSVCTVKKCWSTCFCVIQLDDRRSHLGTSEQLYAWSCNLKFPRWLLRQFGTGLGFWWMFLVLK